MLRSCFLGFFVFCGVFFGSSSVRADLMTFDCDKFTCLSCSYVYDPAMGDPDNGVPPGTPFQDLDAMWVCPVDGAPLWNFELVETPNNSSNPGLCIEVHLVAYEDCAIRTTTTVESECQKLIGSNWTLQSGGGFCSSCTSGSQYRVVTDYDYDTMSCGGDCPSSGQICGLSDMQSVVYRKIETYTGGSGGVCVAGPVTTYTYSRFTRCTCY